MSTALDTEAIPQQLPVIEVKPEVHLPKEEPGKKSSEKTSYMQTLQNIKKHAEYMPNWQEYLQLKVSTVWI